MNHLRAVGQPGLFDDACDSVQIPDANTDRSPIRNDVAGLGSQERPSSSTPIIAEDRWLTAIEEPKRRKTYQRGTLYLEPRKRGPSVWKYRYFETVDGNRKRRKAIVGTILDCPTKSEARLASDHLKMQANTESTKPNVTVRPAATAAGIAEDCPRFGFHNLRHGLSTFLIEDGHDPVVVQRMLRQSNVDMTMHYVHNSHKARNAQAQFIERFLPNGGAVADVEEQPDHERVPVRVQ